MHQQSKHQNCFQEWKITNDTICAAGRDSYTTLLSLTACGPYQFTCDSGLCISIDERQGGLECLIMNKSKFSDAMGKPTAEIPLMRTTAAWSISE